MRARKPGNVVDTRIHAGLGSGSTNLAGYLTVAEIPIGHVGLTKLQTRSSMPTVPNAVRINRLGRETQLVAYPDAHHGIRGPSNHKDLLDRFVGWFNKYVKCAR